MAGIEELDEEEIEELKDEAKDAIEEAGDAADASDRQRAAAKRGDRRRAARRARQSSKVARQPFAGASGLLRRPRATSDPSQHQGPFMIPTGQDSLNTRSTLTVGGKTYAYYSLAKAAEALGDISRLPFSMKVLLENLLRFEDGATVTRDDLQAMVDWQKERRIAREIQYRPARVLMQDFTGVPAVVDLAAMRDAMKQLGGDPQKINPLVPVHLVIDHSVMVDEFGTPQSFGKNVELEYARNGERYEFLKWGSPGVRQFQGRAAGHRHLPPGQSRAYRPMRVDAARTRTARRSPIPTHWSAPTAIRRWSTASACSAGASAGSRPRRRCSASRSAC